MAKQLIGVCVCVRNLVSFVTVPLQGTRGWSLVALVFVGR